MNRWVRSRKGVLSWVILTGVITAVLVLQGCQIRRNNQTTDALCALRHDLEVRIANTNEILDDDKDGIVEAAELHGGDIFGIPRALIVSGRANQQDTLYALSDLDC